MSAQTYFGNSDKSRRRCSSRKSLDAYEDACLSSSYAAPLTNLLGAPKVRWAFDTRNGVALRAPLELYVPKSPSNFSLYTGLAWTPSLRQLAPNTNQYAPLQQVNQFLSQHASRPATQQSAPDRSTTASSTPRHAFPSTSGNFPPSLPITYDGRITTQQSHVQQSNRSSSTVNAVNSAGRGALQLFADVVLSDSVIKTALIDTGATFSMISMQTLYSMNNPPPIENFIMSPPRIVGVYGASATVRGYIDDPLIIARTQVRHPVIVVEDLWFPLLVGMDIFGPHDAQLGVGASCSIRLDVERCKVCDEERSAATHLRSIPTVAVVFKDVSLQPCAAARVTVRLPPAVLSNSYFVAEPLPSLFADSGCSALPSVNTIDGCTHVISVVNP